MCSKLLHTHQVWHLAHDTQHVAYTHNQPHKTKTKTKTHPCMLDDLRHTCVLIRVTDMFYHNINTHFTIDLRVCIPARWSQTNSSNNSSKNSIHISILAYLLEDLKHVRGSCINTLYHQSYFVRVVP